MHKRNPLLFSETTVYHADQGIKPINRKGQRFSETTDRINQISYTKRYLYYCHKTVVVHDIQFNALKEILTIYLRQNRENALQASSQKTTKWRMIKDDHDLTIDNSRVPPRLT